MNFEELLEYGPYSLNKDEKNRILTKRLVELTKHHRENCREYSSILDGIGYDDSSVESYTELPFLPVRLFKDLSLKSIDDSDVVKTMTSSGTTGQSVSRIYLDRQTSANQQKTMVKIVNDFTGSSRMPMIILDCPSVVKDRRMFSARGAGILGFSIFGSKKIYALNDEMQLDIEGIKTFLEHYKGEKILLFGFTFMVWQYFYKELVRLKSKGIEFDFTNGILIHGGGWKKLINEAVSADEFHKKLNEICGLNRIHDYYGMVEQTGCIYMQCECGHLHASVYSDVIVRNPIDFSECKIGEQGIIQVVSSIPESYPGHSLLTEDEGVILGEDDCPCGRKGKYFAVLGRLKNAEIRGCSDTFADKVSRQIDVINEGCGKEIFEKIEFHVGDSAVLSSIDSINPMQPFHENVVDFLDDLSKELMKNPVSKLYPDVITLGFWLRRASVTKMKKLYATDDLHRVGRGVVFHIAPSNVAVNYAYSLFAGLLCGNANVVRIPSKKFPQIELINEAINHTLSKHEAVKPYICLIRYDKEKTINDYLSSMCNTRVIWGGDKTIEEIRKSPIPSRTTEITFADRYSLAVIDSDKYLCVENKKQVAIEFYNDTYLSDQNACTSPRAIAWMGDKKDEAKEVFWTELSEVIRDRYTLQPVWSVDKLTNKYEVLAKNITTLASVNMDSNLIVRMKTDRLVPELMDYRGHSGFFYEYDCDDIKELRQFCNDTRCQTIGLIGKKEAIQPLIDLGIKGVDRVVPIGKTMDFDLIWDGYNLVERLTRTVEIQ